MPELHPFAPVRYASDDGEISDLISPPYDVLDEGPKQQLLARNKHNIVAVDLPVTPPKTVGPDEAYEEAGRQFRQWLDDAVLVREDHPTIVAYEQAFEIHGATYVRRSIFAILEIEDFGRPNGGIHRHELTIKGGTDDRLKLMRATDAQLSPIFGIFSDPDQHVVGTLGGHFDGRDPDFRGVTHTDHVEHRCWLVDDQTLTGAITEFMRGTDVFIADGHHRYTTALNYSRENPDNEAAGRCLFVLTALQDPGMIVLPTHRVVSGLRGFAFDRFISEAEATGLIRTRPMPELSDPATVTGDQLKGFGPHGMLLYHPAGGAPLAISATREDPLADLTPDRPEVWRKLDVAVLHELLIDRVLKPTFGSDAFSLKYMADADDARAAAETAADRLAIFVQPTPLEQVCEVSRVGEVMPPKSTYFFPKLATGLAIHLMK